MYRVLCLCSMKGQASICKRGTYDQRPSVNDQTLPLSLEGKNYDNPNWLSVSFLKTKYKNRIKRPVSEPSTIYTS